MSNRLHKSSLLPPFLMVCSFLLPTESAAQMFESEEYPTEEVGEKAEPLTTEIIEESLGREQTADDGWVDSSHEYVGTKADDLAIYLDRFFGSGIEDLESADSNVRLTTRFQWDGDDGQEVKFRVRGNVHLPRINDRVSLVFNGEDDDFRQTNGPAEDEERNEIGLQVKAGESERSRFDVTMSVSSDLNLKPGVRYRFKDELGEWGRIRYTGRADYSDKRRFRHRHSFELDYLTGETSLLRWSNRFEKGQRTEGVEWSTALSWLLGYSIDSAASFSIGASGNTEPYIPEYILEDPPFVGREPDQSSLLTEYGVIFNFRNRLYKDWLYIEFEPGYTQRQRHHFEDRHGVFFGRVNFELWFNRGRESQRKEKDEKPKRVGFDPEHN